MVIYKRGHYLSIFRVFDKREEHWICINDELVKTVSSWESIVAECVTGHATPNLIFYQKYEKKDNMPKLSTLEKTFVISESFLKGMIESLTKKPESFTRRIYKKTSEAVHSFLGYNKHKVENSKTEYDISDCNIRNSDKISQIVQSTGGIMSQNNDIPNKQRMDYQDQMYHRYTKPYQEYTPDAIMELEDGSGKYKRMI